MRKVMKTQFKHRFGLELISLLVMVALASMVLPVALADQIGNNATKGKLLYEENFSTSKGSIFKGAIDANFSYYFGNGKYHLKVVRLNDWRSIAYGAEYNNTILEVEAAKESGPDDNLYGVVFRKVDWSNYYQFIISADGYYQFSKYKGGNWDFISSWKKSNAIHKGNATNLIKVVCDGDQFSFYVNDIKVDDYKDDSFGSGMIGFSAGTNYAEGPVTIEFDSLKIWEIKK
jgi:hypothetical protein